MLRPLLTALCLTAPTLAAAGERFTHTYEMRVGGLRLASAAVAGVAEGNRYAVNANLAASGIVDVFTDGSFEAEVRGTWDGNGTFTPERFSQTGNWRGEERRLDLTYAAGTPVSAVYTPERDPDDDPIPTLSKQTGTIDFLTAVMTLTYPGTMEEICSRAFDAFTFTKRTRIEMSQGPGESCVATYRNIDPETMRAKDPDTYTVELRPMEGNIYEVSRLVGPTDFGRAIISRTN
ncbi:DUF3108 domain-containing protein [Pontivivens ytuae]|uniref:DUF3108 domain-containing protein n=1 Tax=Pontivivens ytuae TaxID=2789856 RepID=A0A7S9QBZ3_9RHOB|nr:DUF3108 domain-containing protein [Pontivivens ytuae]QPH52536.1 DUF3108 domain-containing protein [Pontivivens ytuae]